MSTSLLDQARARFDALHAQAGQLLDKADSESRGFLASEQRSWDKLNTDKAALKERIHQLEDAEKSEAAASSVRAMVGGGHTESRGGTYFPGRESPSFFGDLISARNGDYEAIQRLHTNNAEQRTSAGLGSYTSGHGADFAPPGYLNVVEQARAGAVFANLVHQEVLPGGVSTVNLPRAQDGHSVPHPNVVTNNHFALG